MKNQQRIVVNGDVLYKIKHCEVMRTQGGVVRWSDGQLKMQAYEYHDEKTTQQQPEADTETRTGTHGLR